MNNHGLYKLIQNLHKVITLRYCFPFQCKSSRCQISCSSNVENKGVNNHVTENVISDVNYYKVNNLVKDNDENTYVNDNSNVNDGSIF